MTTCPVLINDRIPIPAGQHPAGLRLIAIFGSVPTAFGANGASASLPRSAWQWVVRLPDGTLGTMCHLVTLDQSPRSQVRVLAAALTSDIELLAEKRFDNARILLGKSCLLEVSRQWCGGRDRPTVATANPLPKGVEPVAVPTSTLWLPTDDPLLLPTLIPTWVRTYANAAYVTRHQQKEVRP